MSKYKVKTEWTQTDKLTIKQLWDLLQSDRRLRKTTLTIPYLGEVSLERKTLSYYGAPAYDDKKAEDESGERKYADAVLLTNNRTKGNHSRIWMPFLTYEGLRDWIKDKQRREKEAMQDEPSAEDND